MDNQPDFQLLRDQWALKAALPSESTLHGQREMDRQANPHNDNYPNKKPRRSEAEIVSDLAYTFADDVLTNQFGYAYKTWLEQTFDEVWGVYKRK